VVKHNTLMKNMNTPCICNGDREERHQNFTFSVKSLMLHNLLGRFSLLLQLEYTKCSCTGTLQARTHKHPPIHVHACTRARTQTQYVLQYSTWHLHRLITHYCWIHLHHQTVSYERETDFFNRTKTFMWLFPHNMQPDCCLFLHSLLVQSSLPSCCLSMM
jgi:hypothetical protein